MERLRRILRRFVLTFLFVVLFASAALAERYQVTVTRQDSNRYTTGTGHLIVTRYCYMYVYYEEAILDWSGYGGELHFLESDDSCDVDEVLGKIRPDPGAYEISVSRKDTNWYEVHRTDLFIETKRCRVRARRDEAILDWRGHRGEILFLDDDRSCKIEAIWAPFESS